MKIIVICGGSSSEREVSIESGKAVFSSVKKRYESEILFLEDDYRVVKNQYKKGDLVFNALHGGYGENGEIQDFFEKEGMSFTGSGSKACRIAINKKECKEIAFELGVKYPPDREIDPLFDRTRAKSELLRRHRNHSATTLETLRSIVYWISSLVSFCTQVPSWFWNRVPLGLRLKMNWR